MYQELLRTGVNASAWWNVVSVVWILFHSGSKFWLNVSVLFWGTYIGATFSEVLRNGTFYPILVTLIWEKIRRLYLRYYLPALCCAVVISSNTTIFKVTMQQSNEYKTKHSGFPTDCLLSFKFFFLIFPSLKWHHVSISCKQFHKSGKIFHYPVVKKEGAGALTAFSGTEI